MKKTQTPQSSKKKRKPEITVTDVYLDLFTLQQKPISQAFIERLSGELLEWAAKNKDALTVKEFVLNKGIQWRTFMRWTQSREPLKSVYEDVKLLIANRREKGMLKREYDTKCGMHMQYLWDDDWKQADEYHSSLRKKEQSEKQQGPVNVYMTPFGKADDE
jgi:hypothetical protein